MILCFYWQKVESFKEKHKIIDVPFTSCPQANSCGRTGNISYYLLPHIDETDPPMSKRLKAIMTKRPSVERMIKRLKCDLGDDRLTKRGNSALKAYLDKTLIAYHILLRH